MYYYLCKQIAISNAWKQNQYDHKREYLRTELKDVGSRVFGDKTVFSVTQEERQFKMYRRLLSQFTKYFYEIKSRLTKS